MVMRPHLWRSAVSGEPLLQTLLSIQYLRGVAALMVVLFHATNRDWRVGQAGVDIFFFISGFIMWTTTVAPRSITPQKFLTRRLIRIVPLYWAITLFTAWIALTPKFRIAFDFNPEWLLRSLLFLPSAGVSDGHVHQPATFPVLPVGWTLNLEMFFYIIFTIALFLPEARRLLTIVILVSAPVVAGWVFRDGISENAAFYGSPLMLEFAGGVVIGAMYSGARVSKGVLGAAGVLGLILIAFLIAEHPPVGFSRIFRYGLPAAALIAGAVVIEPLLQKRPITLLKILGDASYSIYLAHIPAMALVRKLIGVSNRTAPPWSTALFITLAAALLCVGLYYAFERPLGAAIRRVLGLSRHKPAP